MGRIWDLEAFAGNTALVDESGMKATYSELNAEANRLAEKIGHRCLVFALCRNTAGSVLGYTAFLNSGIVPVMVNSHLDSLEKLGYIRRETGKRRSITLTERCTQPEGIPILGTVAAGQPILAVEDAEGYLTYTPERAGEYFALRIKGDSMIRAGILDGDMVVVRSQSTADHGQIVIALLGEDATCKRLWHVGGRVMLMPENEAYQPIDGTGARILGRVTAVVRTYS